METRSGSFTYRRVSAERVDVTTSNSYDIEASFKVEIGRTR